MTLGGHESFPKVMTFQYQFILIVTRMIFKRGLVKERGVREDIS